MSFATTITILAEPPLFCVEIVPAIGRNAQYSRNRHVFQIHDQPVSDFFTLFIDPGSGNRLVDGHGSRQTKSSRRK